jgi:multidrug efflux system outer membrane protein
MRGIIIIPVLVLFIAGCMLGPDYRRPGVDVPQDWRFQEQETHALVDTQWWEQFNDPVLNDLSGSGLRKTRT